MPENDQLPPLPPGKPEPADCCGGGCVICVYDAYETALERYQEKLAAWEARRQRSPVPSPGPQRDATRSRS